MKFSRLVVVAVASLVFTAVQADAELAEALRRKVETLEVRPGAVAGGPLRATRSLRRLYVEGGFEPVWIEAGRPGAAARAMLRLVEQAQEEGLNPSDYHAGAIRGLLDETGLLVPSRLADLDLLLSDAALLFGAHLVGGRVKPDSLDADWVAVGREVDLVPHVRRAAAGSTRAVMLELRPKQPGYERLRAALGRMRKAAEAGGWTPVPAGATLKPGERDPRVAALRQRLGIAETDEPALFDDALADAVRAFQRRNGLEDDGAVGSKTLAALNASPADRVRQIELNLERWRWLPQDLGEHHILVNVPQFELYVSDAGERVLSMRVIVGRAARRTPVFSERMRYLVLSPTWEVPPTILRQDKLPAIKKDPGYAAKNNMRVFLREGDGWRVVDATAVDWSGVTAGQVRLRQDAGPWNALGLVKFMFPNRFNVYLHDTPGRELFAKTERDFSSGCIRIEKPLDLAVHLLRDDPNWTRESLTEAMNAAKERTVHLPRPYLVHVLYWTAFADENGEVQFRRDLYGRDARLDAALRQAAVNP